MRVSHVVGVALGGVVMLAAAARTRAEEPSAPPVSGTQQAPRGAAPSEKRDLTSSGVAPERAGHRIGILAEKSGRRSTASFRRGATAAVMATAIENAAHGPGAEPPMWGAPSGIDLRAAASVIHAQGGSSATAAASQQAR